MQDLDDLNIPIRLKHVNFMSSEPTNHGPRVPPRRKQSQKVGQRALASSWIHTKALIGWVEKYFVLWNDLKLIYYSSNNQRKLQQKANLAIYSRGKYNWAPTRKREGCLDIRNYDCFIPVQNKDQKSFPRLHLHHNSDPKRNLYLSFKDKDTRDTWLQHITSLKNLYQPPLSEDIEQPSDLERGQSLFSSMIFDEDLDTDFISVDHLKCIIRELPMVYQFSRLIPAFATRLDGISFQCLFSEIMDYPTLLVIDASDIVFSVFIPKCQGRFYGTNTDFRFAMVFDDKVEMTQPDASEIISLICEKEIIGISCGPDKRFCLGKDMAYGQFVFDLSKSFPEFRCRSLMAFILSDDENIDPNNKVCA
jgi:hypothetical protein